MSFAQHDNLYIQELRLVGIVTTVPACMYCFQPLATIRSLSLPAKETMKHPITLRIDTALLQAARHRAQTENRTLTNFVETVLKSHIARAVAPADADPANVAEVEEKLTIPRTAHKRAISKKAAHG